jgi:flagella basal body P-ring formation protein FlgA
MLSVLLIMSCCLSAPAEVTVSTDSITLGQLVPFPASDARSAIPLGYAPNPGLGRRFLKDELLMKIGSAGLPADDLRLPDSILVHRSSQTLDRGQVMRAVRDGFIRQYPSANIEIISIEVPEIQVGTGRVDMLATLPPRADAGGPVYVKLDLRGDSFSRTAYIRTVARIETSQPVIVRPVAAQSHVLPEDVEWKSVPLQGLRGVLTSLEPIEGMVAKRDLEPGTVLSADLLYSPIYVRKGDAVTVRATSGSVTVSAMMRAKEAGKFGDSIQVEHLSGTGTTTARVVGPRTLEAIQGAK